MILERSSEFTVPDDEVYFRGNNTNLVLNPELSAFEIVTDQELQLLKNLSRGKLEVPDTPEEFQAIDESLVRMFFKHLFYLTNAKPVFEQPDPKLRVVYYAITEGCNLRCPYCYASAGIKKPNELSPAEATHLIEQIADAGATTFVFTGGEPMLRADLLDQAEFAKSLGLKVNIITNGTIIKTEEIAKRMAKTFDAVTISVDGGTEELHESTRGRGTFKSLKRAIELLNGADVAPFVNHVLTDKSVDSLRELEDFLRQFKTSGTRLMMHGQLGRGEQDQYSYGWETYLKSYRYRYCSGQSNFAPNQTGLPEPLRCKANCGYGGDEIYVNSIGQVFPCKLVTDPVYKAGSIRTSTIRDIMSSSILEELRTSSVERDGMLADCNRCYVRGTCGGGCRAMHQSFTGSLARNCRNHCRVLRHMTIAELWTKVGQYPSLSMTEDQFIPFMVGTDKVHAAYEDWRHEQFIPLKCINSV